MSLNPEFGDQSHGGCRQASRSVDEALLHRQGCVKRPDSTQAACICMPIAGIQFGGTSEERARVAEAE